MAEEIKKLTLAIICETMFSSDADELVGLAGSALGFTRDALNFGLLDIMPIIGPMRLEAKRKALHGQIEDIILDQSAVMVLSLFPRAAIARSNVQGLALVPRATYPTVSLA